MKLDILLVVSIVALGTVVACAKVDDNIDQNMHGDFREVNEPGSLYLVIDKKTNCEYIRTSSGGLTPRMGSCPELKGSNDDQEGDQPRASLARPH